jgi:hypothetical protein
VFADECLAPVSSGLRGLHYPNGNDPSGRIQHAVALYAASVSFLAPSYETIDREARKKNRD